MFPAKPSPAQTLPPQTPLVDLAIKVMKAKKEKKAYKEVIEPVIKKYPEWYKNPLIKNVKFNKKLYLWCLKHKMYDLIKFVF